MSLLLTLEVLSFTISAGVHNLNFLRYKFVRNLSKYFVQYSQIYNCLYIFQINDCIAGLQASY
jgi:hypothetical protein